MTYLNELVVVLSITFLIWGLYSEKFNPSSLIILVVSVFLIFKVISPEEALSGFSNPSIISVILLLLVTDIIQRTGIVNVYISRMFPLNISYRDFIKRLFLFVSPISAFMNNTPLVALFLPFVYRWCKEKGISPSKALMPLSFAAILGGTITLVGTSTNLVVNGLVVQQGLQPLNLFDFTPIGIMLTISGFLYFYIIGYKFLPERKDPVDSFLAKPRDFTVELIVKENSKLINKTVKEAGLRNLKGLFLVEIIRGKDKIFPVSPEEIIKDGDILIFAGQVSAITDLINSDSGLSFPSHCELNYEKMDLLEVVVSTNSQLVGKRIKDTNFRKKFNAAILAVHRNGEKLSGKIGDIVLKSGDLLLILSGKDFWKDVDKISDFYIVSRAQQIMNVDKRKGYILLVSFMAVLLFSALKIIPLFTGLLILTILIIILKFSEYKDILKSIDVNLLLIIGFSAGIGEAIINSGVAEAFAKFMKDILSPFGILGGLAAIFIITNILTEFITNVAAASIVLPIAIASANVYSVEPVAFILAVAYGASGSFLTPYGYQTNLLVYSAGNYRFKDFIKVGLPLSVIYGIICILGLYFLYLK